MVQVVTNENMQEFIQNRQVPEFKAPEAKTEGASAAVDTKAESSKEAAATDASKEAPRDLTTGKFVKADGEKAPKEEKVEGDKAEKTADEDDDVSTLSEQVRRKIDRIVGKKHRLMKEAEEFGADSYRKRLAAEERAEQLQREIDELKKSGTGPAAVKDGDPKRPKQSDFKTVGEYSEALTEYLVEKKAREAGEARVRQSAEDQVQAQADERRESFSKRLDAHIKANPGYLAMVEGADFDVPNAALQYMVDSEYGPQLAGHIAQHPEIAERLRSLSPPRVIAELGKLEILFEKKPEPPNANGASREVSRAPAPITPLEGKSTTVEKDPSKMSFRELREYERNREAQQRARR